MPVKGIKGIHHVGISVPDIEQARSFYCDVLGFELIERWDFSASRTGDEVLALQDAAAKTIMVAAGNTYLEIFEFSSPEAKTQQAMRPVCDHGYTHLAFEVENIHQVYAELAAAGVQWHRPLVEDIDPETPMTTTYGRDPFGNVIEIQQIDTNVNFHIRHLPRWRP